MARQNKQDPTGQARNRRIAAKKLSARLTIAEREVKKLFREVPRIRTTQTILKNIRLASFKANEVIPIYDYQIDAEELAALYAAISEIVDLNLLETTTDRLPPNFWWNEVIEFPFRQGTASEVIQFNRLITKELVRVRSIRGITTQRLEIGQVLSSPQYLEALDTVFVQNFNNIKSLSKRTADQVIQQINLGIDAGDTPTKIARDISERFDVSRSSAKRIADTEINRAFNDAKLNTVDIAAKESGLRAGVIHISALIPTTRETHAARHGNAYTTAQQFQWWNSGTNRINCHCSTRSVLIDGKGKVIDVELQEEIQAEREFFDQ